MKSHWTRDPVLHFAIIGSLLFGASSLYRDKRADGGDITVTGDRIDHLAAIFERSWQRPPDATELRQLIDEHVREEILYREAVRLGLDQDDTVVRRRMRMKMELLAGDLADAIEPGDEVLQAYYRRHIDRYMVPARYTFEQIYLDSNQRAEVAEDARLILGRLAAGDNPRELGDTSLLQPSHKEASEENLARQFGGSFALQLRELEPGQWAGPVTSAYGEHLVRVSARLPAHEPGFTSVRDTVLRDWQADERQKILQTQYETLRGNYRVEIVARGREATSQ
ncbi:peptidyl-prolyl cis-trans isomerase [Microbulbifer yueqingensis]|uniref:peptidylprolyl isomerase n=1 Tax=Microbulbifer yueqingensis TaxID=658219 RepID=A0A1G8VUL4_9GAMM|nr:peptidylprolyl isomerase [Microbulbifer yueqingensis]SDJ69709.1 PPIC-type PPIASE domain-containing protein [Microbulbifer yueqingensis]